ncbi:MULTISPECIES: STAS domain-containing protein [unclassified Streptomyces]|uniref:STAS domain-containing protein n=1 Tax=unclassified Streptomyces TaxID=2593676 RepID=UPI00278C35A3|nr:MULTISPECIES: STAS domain-containing protein [unclassified Streptomyces]
MNTPPFGVRVVDTGTLVLVRAHGELDIQTAPQLEKALAQLHPRHCELDLTAVPFTDSSGINLLIRHHRWAANSGGSLRLIGVSTAVRRVLDVSGVTNLLLGGARSHAPDGGPPGHAPRS